MLPQFYQAHLQKQPLGLSSGRKLSTNQYILLNLLVQMLQWQKQVRIERLAAVLPVPILFESRRRCVQRFLLLPQLSLQTIWFPIVSPLLATYFAQDKADVLFAPATQ